MGNPIRGIRKGDPPSTSMLVEITDNSDAFIQVDGLDHNGRPSTACIHFCSFTGGGGYHPRTVQALYDLIEAIKEDNKDPESPDRYR